MLPLRIIWCAAAPMQLRIEKTADDAAAYSFWCKGGRSNSSVAKPAQQDLQK